MSWIKEQLRRWAWSDYETTAHRRTLVSTLERLEACIEKVRTAEPKDKAVALDALAFAAGCVMDDAARDWEALTGHKWERYVD